MDTILEDRVPESQFASAKPLEDTVWDALFSTTAVPPPPPRVRAKIHRFRDEDDSRSQKKELSELEAAMRASLIDEKAHKLRVLEVAVGAFTSRIVEAMRSTTDGAVIVEDTMNGVPTAEGSGVEKLDLSAC